MKSACVISYALFTAASFDVYVDAFLQLPMQLKKSHIISNTLRESILNEPVLDVEVFGGIYRPFATYAWSKLLSSGLADTTEIVPQRLRSNSSPARGPDGTVVNIEVKSNLGVDGTGVRLARYALLETLSPSSTTGEMESIDDAIHVLNFVIFPTIETNIPLPVLGMDLVTLPGLKHLISIGKLILLHNEQKYVPGNLTLEKTFSQLFQYQGTNLQMNAYLVELMLTMKRNLLTFIENMLLTKQICSLGAVIFQEMLQDFFRSMLYGLD